MFTLNEENERNKKPRAGHHTVIPDIFIRFKALEWFVRMDGNKRKRNKHSTFTKLR